MTIALSIIGGLFGLVASYWYSQTRIAEIIRVLHVSSSPISTLPREGQVETSGRAERATMLSPFARKPCVFWQVMVQRSGRRGSWITIYQNTSTEAFELNDGTGKIEIQPAGAEVILHSTSQKEKADFTSLDPQIEAALKSMGADKTTMIFSGATALNDLMFIERLVELGEKIYVIGNIKYEDGYKAIVSEDKTQLIIADRSKKGSLGSMSWPVIRDSFFFTLIGAVGLPQLYHYFIK